MLVRETTVLVIFLIFDGIRCETFVPLRLTCEQIRNFIDGHNLRRYEVTQGLLPWQPPASDMMYMVWDEELAAKASRWAENGIFGHNPDRTISSNRWNLVGENVHINITVYSSFGPVKVIPSIEDALDGWFNEHHNYGYEPFVLGTEKPIGHYTQMVWASTTHVGCGISQKKDIMSTTTLIVCNYGPTGNYIGQFPYTRDMTGSHRYLHCSEGACDKPYGLNC